MLEERKRAERLAKAQTRRQTVEQNRLEKLKKFEKENRLRYKSLKLKLQNISKKKDQRQDDGDREGSGSGLGRGAYQSEQREKKVKERLNSIRRIEKNEEDEVEKKMNKYLKKMAKAEEVKHNFISSRLSSTIDHLERVNEKKKRHLSLTNDLSVKSKHMRSLTDKYERSQRIGEDKQIMRYNIHLKRTTKQERAHNNILARAREEKERIKSLKKKILEKEKSGLKVKETIDLENEQRKEMQKLRREDHYENYKVRESKFQNIYKKKLINKLLEKRHRIDKIKKQQNRIMSFVHKSKNPSL
ncbi:unnamed protein product [Moneuplotes crassus]|uniref:Uncharacterized protein n=1 Tax=Euplotes crassus TaxID=5936 RepID=A0AAD1U7Y8_EUPCR|nr:unnamed protein product [Moneuplotes crassus]